MARSTVTIELNFDRDLRADSLDADELARSASEALVETLGFPQRDLNPSVVVTDGRSQGHYPVEV